MTGFRNSEGRALKKFSSYLLSDVVRVNVGPAQNQKSYLLHLGLLKNEAAYFEKAANTRMKEQLESNYSPEELDPNLFGYFVEYLYRSSSDGWLFRNSEIHETDYVVLARLFILGDYLQASRFKKVVYSKFTYQLWSSNLSDETVCDLLTVAQTQLPEPSIDDVGNLARHIYQYAANRIERLRKYDGFKAIVKECSELSLSLLLIDPQMTPAVSSQKPSDGVKLCSFHEESIHDLDDTISDTEKSNLETETKAEPIT